MLKPKDGLQFHGQQREAARVTLETMKRKVELELEENLMILKELEMLSGCSPVYVRCGYQPVMVLRVLKNGNIVNPSEQLRLRMREEFLEEAYFLFGKAEERVIVN